MQIRAKITVMLVFSGLLFVILSRNGFEYFFESYLQNQEKAEIISVNKVINSYVKEKAVKFHGTANDWSHWDDTYEYLENQNPGYIEENLTQKTFQYLETSFCLIMGNDNKIKTKHFFDFDKKEFVQFPNNFNFEEIVHISEIAPDISGIYAVGDQFYFVASSEVTDSKETKSANGKMIFGRRIDESIIKELENITNSEISISLVSKTSNNKDQKLPRAENDGDALMRLVNQNIEDDRMLLEFNAPAYPDENNWIQLSVSKSRDLYIAGRGQAEKFILFYTVIMMLLVMLVFVLLGKYFSKPIAMLINEVKNIDTTKDKLPELKINNKDEFAFLRLSINNLLKKIELEQGSVREGKKRLLLTLNSVADGVMTVDAFGNVDFMNPIAEQLTGWSFKEAYGKPFEAVFAIIHEHSREKLESPVKTVFEIKAIRELDNHTILISKDGTERAIEDTAAPIINEAGNVIGAVFVFRDFSERKEKKKRIEYLSYHDMLTGLYNRRFFEQELTRVDTARNLPLSVVYADVNGLKTINDAFGHQYGDLLIKKVADVFKNECRADDIVARTGGDEFIMLLPKTSSASSKNLVKRIQEIIEQETIMDIKLSVSFGTDTKELENQSIWEIMKNSEEIMYHAKIYTNSSKRNAVIKSILNTLLIKSPREEAHSKRVSMICADIGRAYNLSADQVNELKLAGELHDIGKISIDEIVLNKPGKLTESEWSQIKRHPETGYRLLGTSSEFYNIAEYVLSHHERWDGTGYPKKLAGDKIHWNSRVIAIADFYDAMTSERPYHEVNTKEAAAAEIKKNAGKQFDPEIAKVFVEKVLGLEW